MYFRQFKYDRQFAFIRWKMVNGSLDKGYSIGRGNGWQYLNNSNKQTFKLELIT